MADIKCSMCAVFFVILTVIFSGCLRAKSVTLYVTNINETEQSVQLEIFIDDSLCVNDNFQYSSTSPNYDAYEMKFDSGVRALKVVKEGSQIISDTFDLNESLFIYISYGEDLRGDKGKVFIKKTRTDYKLH